MSATRPVATHGLTHIALAVRAIRSGGGTVMSQGDPGRKRDRVRG